MRARTQSLSLIVVALLATPALAVKCPIGLQWRGNYAAKYNEVDDKRIEEFVWDYLQGPKVGVTRTKWAELTKAGSVTSPAEPACNEIRKHRQAAKEAFEQFVKFKALSSPDKAPSLQKMDAEARIKEIDFRIETANEGKKFVEKNFFTKFGEAAHDYKGELAKNIAELNNLRQLAEGELRAKKGVEAAKKRADDPKGATKKIQSKVEQIGKNKTGKGTEADAQGAGEMMDGSKQRDQLKKGAGGSGQLTGGPGGPGAKVGDGALKGKIGDAKTKYSKMAPEAKVPSQEQKDLEELGQKARKTSEADKKVEERGFFGKLWDGIKNNPALTALAVGAVGAVVGGIAGGGKGAIIGALAGAGLGAGVSLIGRATEADETTRGRELHAARDKNQSKLKDIGEEAVEYGEDRQATFDKEAAARKKASVTGAELLEKQKELEAESKSDKPSPMKLERLARERNALKADMERHEKEAAKQAEERARLEREEFPRIRDQFKKGGEVEKLLDERKEIADRLNDNQQLTKDRARLRELDDLQKRQPEKRRQFNKEREEIEARWNPPAGKSLSEKAAEGIDMGGPPLEVVGQPAMVVQAPASPKHGAEKPKRSAAKATAGKPVAYDDRSNWVYGTDSFVATPTERTQWEQDKTEVPAYLRYGKASLEARSKSSNSVKEQRRAGHLTDCARNAQQAHSCGESTTEQLKGVFGFGACREMEQDDAYWRNCGTALRGR